MSLARVFVRFTAAYLFLLVILGGLMGALGARGSAGVNIGALLGAVAWACLSFSRRNGRDFQPRERWQVIGGMVAIDLFLQIMVVSMLSALNPVAADVGVILVSLALIALLHAPAVAIFVFFLGRLARKSATRTTDA